MEAVDCQPDFCLDLFEPSGHGRRRRAIADNNDTNHTNALTEFTKFKENIEYSVTLPGDYDQMKYQDGDQCKNFILISGLLASLLTLSTLLVSVSQRKLFQYSNAISFNLIYCLCCSLVRLFQRYKISVEKPLMIMSHRKVMPDELCSNNTNVNHNTNRIRKQMNLNIISYIFLR